MQAAAATDFSESEQPNVGVGSRLDGEVLMAELTDNSGVVVHGDVDRGAIIQEMDEAKAREAWPFEQV